MATKTAAKTTSKTSDQDKATAAAERYAKKIRPLLPAARQAFGSQAPGSKPRVASDKINEHLLEYVEKGYKMPALAEALGDDISLSGLRRRIRVARAATLAKGEDAQLGYVKRPRGSKDPEAIREAAEKIRAARNSSSKEYGDAVREAYANGLALKPIADELGISYFSLWSSKRSAY